MFLFYQNGHSLARFLSFLLQGYWETHRWRFIHFLLPLVCGWAVLSGYFSHIISIIKIKDLFESNIDALFFNQQINAEVICHHLIFFML